MAQPINQFLSVGVNTHQQAHTPTSQLGVQLITAMQVDNHPLIQQILANPAIHQIPAIDLGLVLILSIQKSQDQYYDDILQLPNADNIPANGYGGIGHAFVLTCQLQESEILEGIQQHPMFQNIAANGLYGLREALARHIEALIQDRQYRGGGEGPPDPKPDYLQAILAHPQANQIVFNGQIAPPPIGNLLFTIAQQARTRFNNHDRDLVVALLNPVIAHLIPHSGLSGLGRILAHAAFSSRPAMVNAILALPYNINSIEIAKPNSIEQHFYLQQVGLGEILYLAVNNFLSVDNTFYFTASLPGGRTQGLIQGVCQDQLQIVQALVNHLVANNIHLSANGPFSLADSLTSAAIINENLVPIILTAPSSQLIIATAVDNGGLDEALCNAAEEGHLLATQSILGHPNAPQIQIAQLRAARNTALQKGFQPVEQTIQNFAQINHGVNL